MALRKEDVSHISAPGKLLLGSMAGLALAGCIAEVAHPEQQPEAASTVVIPTTSIDTAKYYYPTQPSQVTHKMGEYVMTFPVSHNPNLNKPEMIFGSNASCRQMAHYVTSMLPELAGKIIDDVNVQRYDSPITGLVPRHVETKIVGPNEYTEMPLSGETVQGPLRQRIIYPAHEGELLPGTCVVTATVAK